MAWLDTHPPRRSQFRRGRRARLRPVIVGHTAESNYATSTARSVANFIRNRTDPGSYHQLTDRTEALTLVDLANEAYHDGTGSNPWSMSISAACRTTDWARMTPTVRAQYLQQLAVAAARCNAHSIAQGAGRVEPRRITRTQSEAGVSGFIPHGDRDPGRRTDWGTTTAAPFPWLAFFDHYRRAIGSPTVPVTPPEDVLDMNETQLRAIVRSEARAANPVAVRDSRTGRTWIVGPGWKLSLVQGVPMLAYLQVFGQVQGGSVVAADRPELHRLLDNLQTIDHPRTAA